MAIERANDVKISEKDKTGGDPQVHFTVANLIFLKNAIMELKGDGPTRQDRQVWIGGGMRSRLK